MGEILDIGTEAETCLMAGRGMNGLKGVIVCFNESNGRYTLELDSGEMMSLRARNVRAYAEEESLPDDATEEKDAKKPSFVKKEVTKFDSAPKKEARSSLPKYTDNHVQKESNTDASNDAPKGNFIDRFLYAVLGAILDMSPSLIILALLAGYYTPTGSSLVEGPWRKRLLHQKTTVLTTTPTMNTTTVVATVLGTGGGGGWHWPWFWGGFSGLFSILVVSFFIWQFGTKKGKTSFQWRHVKEHVQEFSFWDVMRHAALLEGAFFFIMRVAQNAGGNRGIGGGRRR